MASPHWSRPRLGLRTTVEGPVRLEVRPRNAWPAPLASALSTCFFFTQAGSLRSESGHDAYCWSKDVASGVGAALTAAYIARAVSTVSRGW